MSYIDGRPEAKMRIDVQDYGIVLRHGSLDEDGYGIRDPIVFAHEGKFFIHYDAANRSSCWGTHLATSDDLIHWKKEGPILTPSTSPDEFHYAYDRSGALYVYPFYEQGTWHGFYIGSNFVYQNKYDIVGFPYMTLKATAISPYGPWTKQAIIPFTMKEGTYYETTASSGAVVKVDDTYLQFFSGSVDDTVKKQCKRTVSLARTKDLSGIWQVDEKPILPLEEQIENSSIYFQPETQTWFLFTNHVGISEIGEYTDAVWVYWTQDINHWNPANKATVLDGSNCTWSKIIIGAPSVVASGQHLYLFYDGVEGEGNSHYHRHIGMARLSLPLQIPNQTV
jgi:predicted GH43/DUF377 family glycosyl hydrolase